MLGGIFRGAIHPEMGRRNGVLRAISTFRGIRATTLGFSNILYFTRPISMRPSGRRCGRCGELRTVEQVRAPPRHGRTERRETRSEARSLLECGARTSVMHLETKVDVI
jgi:hypothetical protein